jgi:predicted metal-dependent peptidase
MSDEDITVIQKKELLKQLVNDEEIIMLFDGMNDCYRPMWKKEWDIQIENAYEKEAERLCVTHSPYTATEEDIDMILENGLLEWEYLGKDLCVKIWW